MGTASSEHVGASTERLLRDLKAVVHDGEELLRAGARDLSERGVAARESLTSALEMAKDTQRRLRHQAKQSAKATDRVIRKHPYESVAIALGLGILAGILCNRR